MTNLFLLAIGIFTLAFIWLIWLRQNLIHALSKIEQIENVLRADFEKRNSKTPYFLESCRHKFSADRRWLLILRYRAELNQPNSSGPSWTFAKELDFEKALLHFAKDTKLPNIQFLEAKKEIMEMTHIIERKKNELNLAATAYNDRKKTFPYSLASAIFGLRTISF
jgi:hypothetical protein